MAMTRVSPGMYRGANGSLVRSNTPPSMTQQPQQPKKDVTIMPVRSNNPANNAERRRYQEAVNRLGRYQQGTAEYDKNAGIIKDIGSRLGFNWQKQIGANWGVQPQTTPAQPEAAPAQPAQPTPTQPDMSMQDVANFQSPMTKSLLEAMGKGTNTMRMYEPQNFEGSPMYQFQKQKGMADLERLMAARGLTNSGAEVQANSDFLANLNAQEADKQRSFAEQEAQRNLNQMQFIAQFDQGERENLRDQLNADVNRRMQQQQFEAGRQDNRQRLMTDFLSNVLQMQSNNPIAQLAFQGLGQQSDYTSALMKAIASNTANNYRRSYGGSGGTPPVAPNNDLALIQALMGYGNRADNNSTFDGLLRLIAG